MIYFDNSATTCVDAEVADRAVEIMCRQFGNPSSLHGVGSSAYTELGIDSGENRRYLLYFGRHGKQ